MEQDYILKVEHVSKQFPGVKALDDVSIGVRRGTVHALVGENGAGKSTLIKILAGIYQSYEGSAYIDGKKVNFRKPSDAQAAGISVVHQELKLAESLSVSENIFLGAPAHKGMGGLGTNEPAGAGTNRSAAGKARCNTAGAGADYRKKADC